VATTLRQHFSLCNGVIAIEYRRRFSATVPEPKTPALTRRHCRRLCGTVTHSPAPVKPLGRRYHLSATVITLGTPLSPQNTLITILEAAEGRKYGQFATFD